MVEIYPGLFIGDMRDFERATKVAILSATQTIHYKNLGWNRKTVDPSHPNYLIYSRGKRMSLNWVDGAARYYALGGPESFSEALEWISGNLPCLVHCNRGESRSATLGLLFLAKRAKTISDSDFKSARQDFIKLYPNYKPGGIADYVSDNWKEIQ